MDSETWVQMPKVVSGLLWPTRCGGENIAPVLVLATKAVAPAAPLFLSFVVAGE